MVPPKIKIELPYDPAIPLLGVYPKELKQGLEDMYTTVHSSDIHSSQKVEATQSPLIDEWINKMWCL